MKSEQQNFIDLRADQERKLLEATRMSREELETEHLYSHLYCTPDGNVVALFKLIYTTAIISGIGPYGYEDRWCFETPDEALTALHEWIRDDCVGEPADWIRHPRTGRRWIKEKNVCEVRM